MNKRFLMISGCLLALNLGTFAAKSDIEATQTTQQQSQSVAANAQQAKYGTYAKGAYKSKVVNASDDYRFAEKLFDQESGESKDTMAPNAYDHLRELITSKKINVFFTIKRTYQEADGSIKSYESVPLLEQAARRGASKSFRAMIEAVLAVGDVNELEVFRGTSGQNILHMAAQVGDSVTFFEVYNGDAGKNLFGSKDTYYEATVLDYMFDFRNWTILSEHGRTGRIKHYEPNNSIGDKINLIRKAVQQGLISKDDIKLSVTEYIKCKTPDEKPEVDIILDTLAKAGVPTLGVGNKIKSMFNSLIK